MNVDKLLKKYIFWPEIENDFHKNIDFSKTSISEVMSSVYSVSKENVNLEDYIFKFYAYNEYLLNVRNKSEGFIEEKDTEIFKDYTVFLDDFSKKMASYIVFCCLSESRHSNYIDGEYTDDLIDLYKKEIIRMKDSSLRKEYLRDYDKESREDYSFEEYIEDEIYDISDIPQKDLNKLNEKSVIDKFVNKVAKKFKNLPVSEKIFKSYIELVIDVSNKAYGLDINGDDGELQRYLLKHEIFKKDIIKNLTIEDYLKCTSVFFKKGFSEDYGGNAWANISNHALDFCTGKINTEMFLDKALSLEHNGGDMFNKDYIFNDQYDSFLMNWISDKGVKFETSMPKKNFLFNLQNSSSVMFCSNASKIRKFSSDDEKELQKVLRDNFTTFKDSKIKDLTEEMIANIDRIKDFSEGISKSNKGFIKNLKLDSSFNFPSFNISNFLLSDAKSKNKDILEKEILDSSIYNSIFNKFLFKSEKVEKNIVKKNAFSLINLQSEKTKKIEINKLGGKAKGLVESMELGLNIPKALTLDTDTCLSYLNNKDFFAEEYKKISKYFNDYLKDEDGTPILVSVRSGAPVSMPGMMDTVLNVGIDDSTYDDLVKKYGKTTINNGVISFIEQFCKTKLNIQIKCPKNIDVALDEFAKILIKNDISCNRKNRFPLNLESQIQYCVESVFDSWNSERAQAYRKEYKISENLGTAATIQKMVFGNKNENSLTCVIFSRNCITGEPGIMGEYLLNAQGEDLVSGKKTPIPINDLKKYNQQIFKEIEIIAKKLEDNRGHIQDIEITVEDGIVYVLQTRNAVISNQAVISLAKEKGNALADVVKIKNILGGLSVNAPINESLVGTCANPGVINGLIVKTKKDVEKYKGTKIPLIFFADQALPEHAPIMIETNGFLTKSGGATSHAAIVARSLNKPCLVGVKEANFKVGEMVTIDATNQRVWSGTREIIKEENKAKQLSIDLLKDEKIKTIGNSDFKKFKIKSWTSNLSNVKTPNNPQKFKSFLSIQQKAAIIFLKENQKKERITNGK